MSGIPTDPDSMLALLQSLSDSELQEMFDAHRQLEHRLEEFGPQDDEELHAWMVSELGIDIPRVSVCEDHDAPFTFISDLYFERTEAALLMANRSGAKTFLVAVLHWLNSKFKPGCESCTFGATEAQSLRAYSHLKSWIYDKERGQEEGKAVLRPEIVSSLMRETTWRNGSKVEVLPGCLPGHTKIVTKSGDIPIGEIVGVRLEVEVRSFDFQKNEFVWLPVVGWHNNGTGDDFLKFHLRGLSGATQILECTSGHGLFDPVGNKKSACEFHEGEYLAGGNKESYEIVCIEQLEGTHSRFDLTVPPHKSYLLANGVIVSNTPQAVNGPHPQKAHADEIELMDDLTWKESRSMTVSKRMEDGRIILPQDIATSTRKGPNGRMQELIDEIEKAVREGFKPPRKLYKWCLKETAAQVPNCRIARPDLPDDQMCNCNKIRRGEWEDGSPRLLQQICNGDFHKSRGWQPFGDVAKQFTENDRETFEVQQLCAKPEMRHHYVPQWRDDKHCIRGFMPDPANGPIYQAIDWGGTNAHSVNWYQLLQVDLDVLQWVQPDANEFVKKRLIEGTIVVFDEIYIAEIGNEKLGQLVKDREAKWRRIFRDFRVSERFADPQGKAARMDWKAMGLRTSWHTTREFDEHIKIVRDFFDDDLIYVDGERCPMFVREIKKWRADPKSGNQIDEFNHAMSNFRYALANIKKVRRRSGLAPKSVAIPRASVRIAKQRQSEGPIGYRGTKDEFSNWRKSLGGPITRDR